MAFGVVRAALLGLTLAMVCTPAVAQTAAAAGSKAVTFDWFAKAKVAAKPQATPKIVLVRYLGSGSYICSPAGSGLTSRCFKRGN